MTPESTRLPTRTAAPASIIRSPGSWSRSRWPPWRSGSASASASRRRRSLLLVAVALIVWATGLLAALPNPEKVIEDIAEALGPWTYALVGVMAFLETGAFVGLVAPGEFTVIIGGVVAGQGEIDIVPLIGLAWFCCVARRHGQLLHRPQARPLVPRQARPEGEDHAGDGSRRSRATSTATAARRC